MTYSADLIGWFGNSVIDFIQLKNKGTWRNKIDKWLYDNIRRNKGARMKASRKNIYDKVSFIFGQKGHLVTKNGGTINKNQDPNAVHWYQWFSIWKNADSDILPTTMFLVPQEWQQNYVIGWEWVTVIDKESNRRKCYVRDSICYSSMAEKINQDKGNYDLANVCDAAILVELAQLCWRSAPVRSRKPSHKGI